MVGVITDLFSSGVRVVIAIVGALLLAAAALGSTLVTRIQRADEEQIVQLKARLAEAGATDRALPDQALRRLAPVIFRAGTSWRMTVFTLEGEGGAWFLRPRLRCAASELYEATGRARIPLAHSVLRELPSLDLPASGEVGDAPDREAAPDEWRRWQGSFSGNSEVIESLRMPTRKYAWCAARQPGQGGRTIALVAETVQAGGINADVLGSSLLSPMLEMLLRLVELPESIEPVR